MAKKLPATNPKSPYFTDRVKRIYMKAVKGDKAAEAELKAINKKIVKQANSRISRLKKAGFRGYLRTQAVTYNKRLTGRETFTTASNVLVDDRDLLNNIMEARSFITRKVTSVAEVKKQRKKALDWFASEGVDLSPFEADELFDFLESDEFQTMKKDFVPSEYLIDDIRDIFNSGLDVEDVLEAYRKVIGGKTAYNAAMDDLGVDIFKRRDSQNA